MNPIASLCLPYLRQRYRAHTLTPTQLMRHLLDGDDGAARNVWVTRFGLDEVMPYVRALEQRSVDSTPLYGIPFVVKDNIDLAGAATTAGCPAYAYTPQLSAHVVQKLVDAGAIPLGKSNLDQFATGLSGTRSPYGVCRNSFDPAYIAGGSSSGSAVAVATGLASFALGTDTAGSGRIPAAFNNIVGLKPSLGRLSTSGVVPACRSLDAVSIFALTAADAAMVLDSAAGFDAQDDYARELGDGRFRGMRFGVPQPAQLEFFGDADYARLFAETRRRLQSLGYSEVEIDFAPFLQTARLLYDGPWVAERYAAVGAFLDAHPAALHAVTHEVIVGGKAVSAAAAFRGQYRLMNLRRACAAVWSNVDFLCTPSAATIYRIADLQAEPLRLNSNLGYYTNYVNLLDLCGVAVPAGFRGDGLPFGVTLVAPSGCERALLEPAARLQHAGVQTIGALGWPMPPQTTQSSAHLLQPGYTSIAVCGAHMDGLPLNHQLRELGAYLLRVTHSASSYKLFALSGGPPRRPGLLRMTTGGSAIELELWALPQQHLGAFLAQVPAPLGIGSIQLSDGSVSLGFLCEAYALEDAQDISEHGGWRAYMSGR